MKTPRFGELMNPILQALRAGGGTLTNAEIVDGVARVMQLPDEVLDRMHPPDNNISEVAYRIAWAKTYLKKAGYLTQSARGVWALTPKGKDSDRVDPKAVVDSEKRKYAARRKKKASKKFEEKGDGEASTEEELEREIGWKQRLLATILKMSPDAFERLSQRLLRECGFTQVEVTGRSGDGGIDGKGVMRLGGLINFQVVFQCKRYSGTVSTSTVRDFRGAMIGRADKGLIITTGTFSRAARAEAIRDGAPAIDLVDGQELADLLKKCELGVQVQTVKVEKVEVNADWFNSI